MWCYDLGKPGCFRTCQACHKCRRSCAARKARQAPRDIRKTRTNGESTFVRPRSSPLACRARSRKSSWRTMNWDDSSFLQRKRRGGFRRLHPDLRRGLVGAHEPRFYESVLEGALTIPQTGTSVLDGGVDVAELIPAHHLKVDRGIPRWTICHARDANRTAGPSSRRSSARHRAGFHQFDAGNPLVPPQGAR
jgi:hypothetical protein